MNEYPAPFRDMESLAGRSMLVAKAQRFDIECVVRGYLSGSGWKEYQRNRSVCGIPLARGIDGIGRAARAHLHARHQGRQGHDENISFEQMCDIVPKPDAERLRALSIDLYRRGRDYARERGIILADTKFEFGLIDGKITLIDEMLTPDSSRFWPADKYAAGGPQESFDKQFVRDYLDSSGWDHNPPGPELPADVVTRTIARYKEAHDQLFPSRSIGRYL